MQLVGVAVILYFNFTPLKFHSPIFAGKVGLSIAAWTAGSNIALTWITAITPKINMLIAEHKWNDLDRIFHKIYLDP